MTRPNNRGIVLFTVLAVIFIAVILANVLLSLVSSHSRFTHHQVSRIQAYYAGQAGMNYALEKLRTGDWVSKAWGPGARKDCYDTPCVLVDGNFPPQIKSVSIQITPYGSYYKDLPRADGSQNCPEPLSNNTFASCIDVTVDYTYP